jgi:hypothetical protein
MSDASAIAEQVLGMGTIAEIRNLLLQRHEHRAAIKAYTDHSILESIGEGQHG